MSDSPGLVDFRRSDKVSHYMSDETYWDPALKGKADIEKTLEVNVARD